MNRPSRPRTATRVGVVLVLAGAIGLAGCGGDAGPSSSAPTVDPTSSSTAPFEPSSTSTGSAGGDLDPGPAAVECPAPTGDLAAFGSASIRVVDAAGSAVARCVLVADRLGLRQQGLMGVSALDGFDGMLFAYGQDSTGGYWMRNTPLPLTIAWIDEDGAVVATADMEPCPDVEVTCPTYEPGAAYRWALEVSRGELGAFGLVDGARLDPASLPVGVG